MGIRNKLVLCLLVVLFPLVAVGTFATHLLDRQMAERTITALSTTQRLEAERISQILDSYASHARTLASGAHVRDFFAKLHAHNESDLPAAPSANSTVIGGEDGFAIVDPEAGWPLQQLALALQRKAGIIGSSVVEIRLVNRDGSTLGESMGFSWAPVDEKLVNRSMRTVKTFFGDAFLNQDDTARLGIVSPVISYDGDVVGALMMESRLLPITSLIAKHERMGSTIEAHIAQPTLDGSAQFITPLRFDRTAAFNKIVSARKHQPINDALHSPKTNVVKALDYRGVESFLAYQTIPSTGWGLVVKIDTAETFAPAEELRSWLRWATVASIGFVAVIYLLLFVPIASRLKRAAAAARQIMDGNLSTRLVDTSCDEITELVLSMNSLAKDLEEDQKMRCEVEARLRHQALHDELTGLLNRKHANKVIGQLSDGVGQENTVMFLDLNGFKDVNDLYGHAAGDVVLRCIAKRLSKEVPQGSTLARWGGDEFVVILPDTGKDQATEFALTLHNVFDEPVTSDEGSHYLSCSIGLATSSDAKSLDDALIEADALMYEQKNRQRFHRSKGGMATRGLEKALVEDRLELWFEPVVRLKRPGNYALVGADTQLRMRTSQGGYVMPEEFMNELVDETLLRQLDERTIDLSLRTLRRWTMARIVDMKFKLSLRLSKQTLNDPVFPILLEEKLKTLNVLPTQIQIEFTCCAENFNVQVIEALHEICVPLALNGVDNEPNLLRYVPATQPSLAIIGKPSLSDTVVLPHLMDTCKNMGVDVMARGVENREQLSQLHALGVSQFQGSLFEKHVTGVDFVSQWGQTRLTGLGKAMAPQSNMRLAG